MSSNAESSPRPRGWSLAVERGARGVPVVPAPAGVVPAAVAAGTLGVGRPRARGGGPSDGRQPTSESVSSPRPRGCPRKNSTSNGGGSSSPRPRGWSLHPLQRVQPREVVPAPAGVVPRPVWAGAARVSRPRARGGGPCRISCSARRVSSSPRPRRWSPGGVGVDGLLGVVPAPAGVVPRPAATPPRRPSASSPRPRGWSQLGDHLHEHAGVVPAPAGVVPARARAGRPGPGRPRARGGGPRPGPWR